MGNTHDTEMARLEADYIHNRWRSTNDYRWGYSNDRGPDSWWVYYPSASGSNQSPIDIVTEDVTFDPDLGHYPLQICYGRTCDGAEEGTDWDDDDDDADALAAAAAADGGHGGLVADDVGWRGGAVSGGGGRGERRESMELVNTGNTATINVHNSQSYVTGGPCKEHNYLLQQIHLHWGEDDLSGSEHLVNTNSYAAEIHLVHWNEDLFSSYDEAIRKEDGVVIIAIFVQVSNDNQCKGLRFIADLLQDITYRDQRSPLPHQFNATAFLPDDVSGYWTYKGSFTTPPCFETVTWILLHEPIHATSRDLDRFRQLKSYGDSELLLEEAGDSSTDGPITRNRRMVQPLGTRRIYAAQVPHTPQHQTTTSGGYFDDPFRPTTTATSGASGGRRGTHNTVTPFPEFVRQCGRA